MSVPNWTQAAANPVLADAWISRGVLTRRVLAFLVDVLAIGAIAAGLWCAMFVFGLLTLGLGLPLLGLLPAVPPLYHFLFLASSLSATPGQALLGLVVRRNADLGRPDLLEALVSVVGFYATLMLGAVWLAVALLTTRRRTLHDMVAGLVVVRRDALAWLGPLTTGGADWNMGSGGAPQR